MRTIESIELIYRDPAVRGGRPCLVGTGLRVMDIALQQPYGESSDPAYVAQALQIGLAEVHAALSYFYSHQEEIDKDIKQDRARFEKMKTDGVVKSIHSYHS
ncbi:MAG: DUF433 domain-containing protein [Chloroflexi bacterium]|nr:DUF433 domain-containing protein [Chloroflexota bacterium]